MFGRAMSDDPDDAPELLDGFFEQATIRDGDTVVRRGRPRLGDDGKVRVGVRLDPDVLAAYKQDGPGWQTRINADLRKANKLKRA